MIVVLCTLKYHLTMKIIKSWVHWFNLCIKLYKNFYFNSFNDPNSFKRTMIYKIHFLQIKWSNIECGFFLVTLLNVNQKAEHMFSEEYFISFICKQTPCQHLSFRLFPKTKVMSLPYSTKIESTITDIVVIIHSTVICMTNDYLSVEQRIWK